MQSFGPRCFTPKPAAHAVNGEGFAIHDVSFEERFRGGGDPAGLHQHERAYIYLPLSGRFSERGLHPKDVWTQEAVELRAPRHRHALTVAGPARLMVIAVESWRYRSLLPLFDEKSAPHSMPTALLRGIPERMAEAIALDDDDLTSILLTALALELVGQIALIVRRRRPHDTATLVERTRTLVQRNLDRSLDPGSIARSLSVSPGTLERAFRAAAGASVTAFIRRERSALALHLIATTSLSLKEIATRAGYYDQSHMTNALKALTGRTPGELRRTDGG